MTRYFYMLILISLFVLSGCGMAVKTAVNTARGGEYDLYIVDSVQDLRSFTRINLNQFTGSKNERLTPALLTYMNNEIHDELSESGVELSEHGELSISGSVMYLIDSFGDKQILVEVKLNDAKTGLFLGSVNLLGQALGLRGIESAANEVAEGIVELLVRHNYPNIVD